MLESLIDLRRPNPPMELLKPAAQEQAEAFAAAMQRFKEVNRRPFPTWSEAFWVLIQLGFINGYPGQETQIEPGIPATEHHQRPGDPPASE